MSFHTVKFEAGSDESRNVAAALRAARMDWRTTLKPVFVENPDAIGGIEAIEGQFAVVREDTNAPLGVVGSQYTDVQNDAAMGPIQPLLDSGEARLISAGWVQGGRRVYVQAQLRDGTVDVRPGDAIFASANFATGHDGTLQVSLGYSSTRVVCQNTMAAMIKSLAWRARHTKGVQAKLDEMVVEFSAQRDALRKGAERFRSFTKRKLDDRNLVRFVREVLSEGAGENEETIVRGVDRIVELAHEAPGAEPGTLWGGLNAVTYWATHERGRSEDARQNSLMFGTGAQLIERASAVATSIVDQLPLNELARESYANHATAKSELDRLLGRPHTISAEPSLF